MDAWCFSAVKKGETGESAPAGLAVHGIVSLVGGKIECCSELSGDWLYELKALHCVARGLRRKEGSGFFATRHLLLIPASQGLGDIPGYYRSSLAGLLLVVEASSSEDDSLEMVSWFRLFSTCRGSLKNDARARSFGD